MIIIRTVRKDQVYLLVGLVVFSLVAFYSFGALAKQDALEEKPFFYVVYSTEAEIKINPDNPQLAELIMSNISDYVVKFVKVPPHFGTKIETIEFLEHWNTTDPNSYVRTPPDAAFLVYNTPDFSGESIPVILSHPRYVFLDQEVLIFDVEFSGKKRLTENQYLEDVALFVEESRLSQDQ